MTDKSTITSLEGQFLIAMPSMGDPRFSHSVILLCAHSSDGAMGIVVNKFASDITFPDLLQQLDIAPPEGNAIELPVHAGGPVEPGRGFVLHSADYQHDTTVNVIPGINLTATLDILKAIAVGDGPEQHLLALGYAGWGPGQLEDELSMNGWLTCDADPDMMFNSDGEDAWKQALALMGIDPTLLVSDAGHA